MIPSETKAFDLAPLLAEALREGQSVRFRAEGQSMRPFIHAGDIAVVAPAPPVAAPVAADTTLAVTCTAALIASSARIEQWIFTGGKANSSAISVFLIA